MRRWTLVAFLGLLPLTVLFVTLGTLHLQAAPDAGTVVVNTSIDENDGSCIDGDCSLRDAIVTAVADDTIIFDAGLSGEVIDVSPHGKLVIDKNLTISGTVPITISGNNLVRVFEVSPGRLVSFFSLTIANGNSSASPDCPTKITTFACGGAMKIYGSSEVTVTHVLFTDNTSELGAAIYLGNSDLIVRSSTFISNTGFSGGGISVGGTGNSNLILIQDSIFVGNSATEIGGAIDSGNADTLLVQNSLFAYNTAIYGGALHGAAYVHMIVQDSTLHHNSAQYGGAIMIGVTDSELTIENSTLFDNVAARVGGAIYAEVDGKMRVKNSTISGNSVTGNNSVTDGGGGIAMEEYSGPSTFVITNTTIVSNTAPGVSGRGGLWLKDGTLTIRNSIVAYNSNSNCTVDAGIFNGGNSSIADDSSCPSFIIGNPFLEPLAANGGGTWTHALRFTSPAIDQGNNAICPSTDQRGSPRPIDGDGDNLAVCDIGAHEAPESFTIYLPGVMKR